MTFLELGTRYLSLFWVVTVAPIMITTLISAMIRGKRYIFGWEDWCFGAAIFVLLVYGLPPLAI